MAVSISSLLAAHEVASGITVHVLSEGITEASRLQLRAMVATRDAHIQFHDLPDLNQLAGVTLDFRDFSIATFARLWLAELFPTLSRALYIDCDTLILEPLDDLWTQRFAPGCNTAGILDAASAHAHREIGLSPSQPYVNAGVLLIDLDEWRANRKSEQFLTFLRDRHGQVPHNDQGVLNACLAGEVQTLPAKYNVMTYCLAFSYDELRRYKHPSTYYRRDEFVGSVEQATVVHATGSFLVDRPWVRNSNSPIAPLWNQMRAATPWAGMPLSEPARLSTSHKAARRACASFLRRPAIAALGIAQATARSRFRSY